MLLFSTPRRGRSAWPQLISRLTAFGAATVIVAAVATAQPVVAAAPIAPDQIPEHLRVRAGQVRLFDAVGFGTQRYTCETEADGRSAWAFRQPEAVLIADTCEALGIHGRGPFWAACDGSRVVGTQPTSVPAADPAHDVPWLLLRLETRGGMAPSEPCDSQLQTTLAVPYRAVYCFYGPEG
jgi:hypothetical protein